MMKILALIFIFLLTFFLQSSITTIPLTLLFFLLLTVFYRSEAIFVLAFFSGLFLDALLLNNIGLTSLYSLIFLFLVFLYERKYELLSYQFVAFASFFGSAGYLFLFRSSHILLTSITSSMICICIYFFYTKLRCVKFLKWGNKND